MQSFRNDTQSFRNIVLHFRRIVSHLANGVFSISYMLKMNELTTCGWRIFPVGTVGIVFFWENLEIAELEKSVYLQPKIRKGNLNLKKYHNRKV